MGDTRNPNRPDYQCLFNVASSQHGHFTAAQARNCGFSWERLSSGATTGRFIRLRRGLYRLRDYPWFYREGVVSAWLAVGKNTSIVSHESALELYQLSDVLPHWIHLTVPRSRRNHPRITGVKIHTTTRPLGGRDIAIREGIRLTSVPRTILDAAEAGTGPEQIEMAIWQARERGQIIEARLAADAGKRCGRVQRLVTRALNYKPQFR